MRSMHKPIGGVESVALYPADAVDVALFSSCGCEVSFFDTPIEVELLDDSSVYEEKTESRCGVIKVTHRLTLVADRDEAEGWLSNEFLERASLEGVVATVKLCDGRRLLVGYSANFRDEQPLRLESVVCSSGSSLHDRPTTTLLLVSQDTEFSQEIL